MSSKDPKVAVIGDPEQWPKVFVDGNETPFKIEAVEFGTSWGAPYVLLRVPASEVSIRTNG